MPKGSDSERFIATVRELVAGASTQTMLTSGICNAFASASKDIAGFEGVEVISSNVTGGERTCAPQVFVTTSDHWLSNPGLAQEMFGPAGVIVLTEGSADYSRIAQKLSGQLTCTVLVNSLDNAQVAALLTILERKAGRIIKNSFPTGVEVADAMVHGGPYPASTNFGATSVGTMAVRRFLRPVCFQGFDAEFEPNSVIEARQILGD